MGTNSVRVWAWRPFVSTNETRSLKLGTRRRWAIGFFDMSGLSAYSPDMELNLETERMTREPQAKPSRKSIVKN